MTEAFSYLRVLRVITSIPAPPGVDFPGFPPPCRDTRLLSLVVSPIYTPVYTDMKMPSCTNAAWLSYELKRKRLAVDRTSDIHSMCCCVFGAFGRYSRRARRLPARKQNLGDQVFPEPSCFQNRAFLLLVYIYIDSPPRP